MSVYGITQYGTDVYGLSLPPAYLAIPFEAAPVNYGAIRVTWKQPSGVIFRWRFLSNRKGYPVNENDGKIIYDSLTYPSSNYYDTDVIPGEYHYYAMYVLADVGDNIWVRSGVTACLMPKQFQSSKWFFDRTPEYFRTNPTDGSALTDDAAGNTDLVNFQNVVGWGFDYIRTQYDVLINHLNDPQAIPLNDLYNLASQVGLTFSPETPAAVVRKAAGNWAHISQERGTLHGLSGEISLRTGYPADVQTGANMVLEDDQAQFLDPIFLTYSPVQVYHAHECVHFFGCWFECLIEGTYNTPPAAARTSNSNWLFINDLDDTFNTLLNPVTNNPSTWEALDSSATNGIPTAPSTTLTQGIGVVDPLDATSSDTNSLRLYNRAGSAKTLWARSVSRRTVELGTIPDGGFETGVTVQGALNTRKSLVPGSWPVIGQPFQTLASAYWTPTNCQLTRTQLDAHAGTWSMEMSPFASTTPITLVTGQLDDPGFEQGTLWTGYNCTVQLSSVTVASGQNALEIIPLAAAVNLATSGLPPTGQSGGYVTSPQVACVPSVTNTVSASLLCPVNIRLDLQFFDESGNALTSVNGTAASAGSFTTFTTSGTAPANAATMAAYVVVTGTPSVTQYAYVDTVAFSATGSGPGLGAASAQSPWITCPAGTAVTGSVWLWSADVPATTTFAAIQWLDGNGTVLSTTAGTPATLAATTWTDFTASGTSPANTAYAALVVGETNARITDVILIDDATISAALSNGGNFPPENIQAIQDGIPVPWVRDSQIWNPLTRYKTNDIVLFNGQPFQAQRASTNAPPPTSNIGTAEWAPLSQNRRIRVLPSAYLSQNLSVGTDKSTQTIPFVEWFDKHGNFIARVFARNPNSGGGVVAVPDALTFDSFTGLSLAAGTSGGAISLSPWSVIFYNTTDLSGPVAATRFDASISESYNQSPQAGVADSGWSAVWSNSFVAPTTGSYTFALTQTGGGSRMFVNGSEIINNWTAGDTGTINGSIALTAGQTVNLEIDYFEIQSTGGNFSSNLLSGWHPGNLVGISGQQVSPVFSILSSAPYLFSAGVHSNNTVVHGDVTIAWMDSLGNVIATSTTGRTTSGGSSVTLSLSGNTPAGASQAQVTITGSGSAGQTANIISPNFQDQSPVIGGGLGSLSLGTITAPTSVSGLVVSSTLAGRHTDDEQAAWTVPAGAFTVGGFEGGSVWPADPTVRSVGLITGAAANANIGVTFRSDVTSGNHQGIVFRYSDNNNYWQASRAILRKKVAGTFSTVGTYSTAFSDNDRMVVQANGSVIKVFRNGGNQVLSVTDSFNSTATSHGIEAE